MPKDSGGPAWWCRWEESEQLDFLRAREDQALRQDEAFLQMERQDGQWEQAQGEWDRPLMRSLVQSVTKCFRGLPTAMAVAPQWKQATPPLLLPAAVQAAAAAVNPSSIHAGE